MTEYRLQATSTGVTATVLLASVAFMCQAERLTHPSCLAQKLLAVNGYRLIGYETPFGITATNRLITKRDAHSIARCDRLIRVEIENCELESGVLTAIMQSQSLRSVVFDGVTVDDREVDVLRGAPALKDIAMSRCNVTDAMLSAFGRCTHLRSLILHECRIDASSFELMQNASVASLSITDSEIETENNLRGLELLRNLTHLDLSSSQVSDEGLLVIYECHALSELALNDINISPESAAEILLLPVQELHVVNTGVPVMSIKTALEKRRFDRLTVSVGRQERRVFDELSQIYPELEDRTPPTNLNNQNDNEPD